MKKKILKKREKNSVNIQKKRIYKKEKYTWGDDFFEKKENISLTPRIKEFYKTVTIKVIAEGYAEYHNSQSCIKILIIVEN